MKFRFLFLIMLLACVLSGCCKAGLYNVTDPTYERAGSATSDRDHFEKAKKYYDTEDYDKAINNFSQYIKDKPDGILTVVAIYYLAESYEKKNNIDKALETYQRLVNKYKTGEWVMWSKENIQELKGGHDSDRE